MHKKIVVLGLVLGLAVWLLAVKPLISPTIKQPAWKTHFNVKYGHQFSYPSDWQVEEWDIEEAANLKSVPDGSILHQGKFFGPPAGGGHFEVLIWENKSKAPVKTWLGWFRHEDLILKDLPKSENFEIAGLPAIRYFQQKTSRKKPILYIFFGKGDKIYELTQEREDLSPYPIYDKILQSFQFVVE